MSDILGPPSIGPLQPSEQNPQKKPFDGKKRGQNKGSPPPAKESPSEPEDTPEHIVDIKA